MLTETMLNSLLQRAYLVLGCSWQREGGPRARMLLIVSQQVLMEDPHS